jgi:aspartyl/asparaginyl beta-hydroxylase (cupin superfamily)
MSDLPPDPAQLAQADQAMAAGDLAQAADILTQAFAGSTPAALQWLQLAGLRRALRQPRRALAAVDQALRHNPLDFMALVMRAGLLESLDPSLDPQGAGGAWEEALAQQPDGPLAPPLAAAVAKGATIRDAWRVQRAARLAQASQAAEAQASGDMAWRMARFRSNVLRQTRPYYSEPTHFFYPGLAMREYHPAERFPWLADLAQAAPAITQEMMGLMASQRAQLAPYIQYDAHQALRQWQALNHNPDWTAIHLIQRGERVAANAAQCPITMDLLARLPQPQIAGASANAMFSLLAPHTAIPPHVGVNNARLVCHLPLVVPDGCWFRVGAETRLWREGEPFVFDDTIEHEALNPSDQLRVVLIFDVWHPDLSPLEQQMIARIIATEQATGALG